MGDEHSDERFMIYPSFELIKGRGIIPNICLPINFKLLVPRFYEQKRREILEEYSRGLEIILQKTPFTSSIKLIWDDRLGLTNIGVGACAGLDLDERNGWPSFQEHNLGNYNSFTAGCIATKYIHELIKSE